MINERMYIELNGYDSIEKAVRAYGSSGGLYIPKIWIGSRVNVILIDETHNSQGRGHRQDKRKTTIPLEKKLYKLYGYGSLIKTVKKKERGAIILLPLKWVGKYVKVILLDNPLKEKEEVS